MEIVLHDTVGNTVRFGRYGCTAYHMRGLVLVEIGIVATKAKHVFGLVEWLPKIRRDRFLPGLKVVFARIKA